MNNRGSVACE